jgi:hypothetical protein
MADIDQRPSFATAESTLPTIETKPANQGDEILLALKIGLNTSSSSAAISSQKKDLTCKDDHMAPTQKPPDDCKKHCVCGGNIFLSGCCAMHTSPMASAQSDPSLVASSHGTEIDEIRFLAMFREYFGIPSTVDIV